MPDEGTPEVTSVVEMKPESIPEADIPETVEMPAVILKPQSGSGCSSKSMRTMPQDGSATSGSI